MPGWGRINVQPRGACHREAAVTVGNLPGMTRMEALPISDADDSPAERKQVVAYPAWRFGVEIVPG